MGERTQRLSRPDLAFTASLLGPMNSTPPFHPYGTAHLIVIFLTITLPFAFAPLVRWTKPSLIERIIVARFRSSWY